MKRINILLITAIAIASASCKVQEIDEIAIDETYREINATIISDSAPQTKTHMGELSTTYPVLWSEGDQIGLLSGGVSTFTLVPDSSDGTKASFSGTAAEIVGTFPSTSVFPAAYPAQDAFADVSGGEILVGSYLPVKQTYINGTFSDNVYPMASVSMDGLNYGFYNLGGVIQLRLKGNGERTEKIKALYLTGNNGETIAGGVGMKFNVTTGEPVASSVDKDYNYKVETYGSEHYERVIIDFGETPLELSESEAAVINIAVIPQTFTKGFTVELVDGVKLGSTYLAINDPITIKRSHVKQMKEINYNSNDVKPLEVANSYIFTDAGYYLMPAFAMGNRLGVRLDTEGRNIEADVLWSDIINSDRSLKPAVTNIEYLKFADGQNMLQFKINIDPDTGQPYRGNTVVSIYDADTKVIIWSWHIWMTEQPHDVITNGSCSAGSYTCEMPGGWTYDYEAEASDGALVILDRNLGAISANPADGWKTYGLYYQNGRYNPFIGGYDNGSAVRENLTTLYAPNEQNFRTVREWESDAFGYATAPTWHNKMLAEYGWHYGDYGWLYKSGFLTVTESIHQPMVFSSNVANDGNGQWTDYENSDNKSWLDNSMKDEKGKQVTTGTHGATGLSDGGHEAYWNRTKTIMDPCPVGYSVLGKGNGDGDFFNKDVMTYTADETNGIFGCTSTYNGTSIWWPAAGFRDIYGKMADVGYIGAYFHFDHIAAEHGGHGSFFRLSFNNKGQIQGGWEEMTVMTNHASSVRCVREKQDTSKYPLK